MSWPNIIWTTKECKTKKQCTRLKGCLKSEMQPAGSTDSYATCLCHWAPPKNIGFLVPLLCKSDSFFSLWPTLLFSLLDLCYCGVMFKQPKFLSHCASCPPAFLQESERTEHSQLPFCCPCFSSCFIPLRKGLGWVFFFLSFFLIYIKFSEVLIIFVSISGGDRDWNYGIGE